MTKELLTVEFRYSARPKSVSHSEHTSRKVTIDYFNTIDEAIKKGNEVIELLSRDYDFLGEKFKLNYLFGTPRTLVCSRNHEVFVSIDTLHFDDLEEVMNQIVAAKKDYQVYLKEESSE